MTRLRLDDGVQATFATIRLAEIATIMPSALSQFLIRIKIQEMNTLNQVDVERIFAYVMCFHFVWKLCY